MNKELLKEKTDSSVVNSIALNNALRSLQALSPAVASDLELKTGLHLAVAQKLANELLSKSQMLDKDIDSLIDTFINRYQSQATRATYTASIALYCAWLAKEGIHILEVKGTDADRFAAYCHSRWKARTANTRINTLSSFYNWLEKREHITRTPFIAIIRGKGDVNKVVPSPDNIERACNHARPHVASAIVLLQATGLRLGALCAPSASIAGGQFTSVTKGRRGVSITVAGDMARVIRKHLPTWKGLSANCLSVQIHRAFRNTDCAASAHGLRHSYAVALYTRSGNNIEAVRRALGHGNIAITSVYLQSLDCDI